MNHPEVRAIRDHALRTLESEWFTTLRDGAARAQQAGWHPEASPEALVAFSVAGAMGAASVFSDASWSSLIDATDLDALADEVLDLLVDRTRTTALPGGAADDSENGKGGDDERRAS